MSQLLRTKSIDALIAASEEPDRRLKKSLGVWSLIALGVGAVIGSGIFTVTGTAAAGEHFLAKSIFKAPVLDLLLNGGAASTLSGRLGAGPAISVSFVLVAIACGFAAICYAELASMIPIAGSAYTYSYATLGEIFAWIIGWDLILEYAFSNMSVAVGFSAYLNDLLDNLFHFHLPAQLSQPIFEEGQRTGAWFNLTGVDRAAAAELRAGARRPRERADQQHHGGDQDRRHSALRLRRRARREHRQLASVHAQRLFGRAYRAAPSSSSLTSDSIRSRPRPRNADARSAICRSGIFADAARSARCSMARSRWC